MNSNSMDEPGGHYVKWYEPGKDKYCIISLTLGIWKKKSNIETESRMVITRSWGTGKKGEMLVKGYRLSVKRWTVKRKKMNKLCGSNVRPGDYNHDIMYIWNLLESRS